MSRATLDDLVRRYGPGDIVSATARALDEDEPADIAGMTAAQIARVDGALADADALIDSYLRRRYALPLAAPSPELVRAACVLARYDLATGTHLVPDEATRLARKDVIGWLERIADGSVELAGAAPAGGTGAGGARVSGRSGVMPATGLIG